MRSVRIEGRPDLSRFSFEPVFFVPSNNVRKVESDIPSSRPISRALFPAFDIPTICPLVSIEISEVFGIFDVCILLNEGLG